MINPITNQPLPGYEEYVGNLDQMAQNLFSSQAPGMPPPPMSQPRTVPGQGSESADSSDFLGAISRWGGRLADLARPSAGFAGKQIGKQIGGFMPFGDGGTRDLDAIAQRMRIPPETLAKLRANYPDEEIIQHLTGGN
jgi:hypothetical protein